MVIRDGGWKLYDYDFQTGRSVWMYDDGNKTVFRTDYPVTSLIEQNKLASKAVGDDWSGDYHRVASVPLNLIYDENIGLGTAMQEGDDKFVSRWLNDSDNRAWRTKGGKV